MRPHHYEWRTCPECKGAGGFNSGDSADCPHGEDSECARCHGFGEVRARVYDDSAPEVQP